MYSDTSPKGVSEYCLDQSSKLRKVIRLCIPSCSPVFESQVHHLPTYAVSIYSHILNYICNFKCEKDKKRLDLAHIIFKKAQNYYFGLICNEIFSARQMK